MSEIRTQSRPYAEATFEIAKADDTLDAWSADFSLIELALGDQKMLQHVETPSISPILEIGWPCSHKSSNFLSFKSSHVFLFVI